MKILYVSDVYFPRVNGVSTSIRTFRQDLAAVGVETVLVAPAYPGAPGDEGSTLPADSAPDVIRVESGRVPGDPEDRRMHWRQLRHVLDGLSGIDLVHVQTPFLAHYAGVRCARRLGVPCVVTYHTFFEEYLHHYLPVVPRVVGREVARRFSRAQCHQAQAVIAPSDQMAVALRAYGVGVPIEVVPTGISADRFRQGDGRRFRAALGIPQDRPVIGYVGRCAHEKNIDFLVDVLASVRRSVPDALLLVAGEGPARAHLEQLTERLGLGESVRFVGYLDRDTELLDCYASLDAFVFASRTETQGLVLLEAMAQGTPVVALAEMGTRSILRDGVGAVVPRDDRADFARAVVGLLTEPSRRAALAGDARIYAERWSSRDMAGRLADVYRRLCAAPATSLGVRHVA